MATCATLPAIRAFRANLERQKVNDTPDGQDTRFFAAFSLLRRHRSAYRLFALPKKFPLNSGFGRFWAILALFSSAFFHPQNKITARSESRSPLLLPRELALVRTLFGSKKDYTLCFLKNPLMQKTQRERERVRGAMKGSMALGTTTTRFSVSRLTLLIASLALLVCKPPFFRCLYSF